MSDSSLSRLNLSLSTGPEGCSTNLPAMGLAQGMSEQACLPENLRLNSAITPSPLYDELYNRLLDALQNQVNPDLGHAGDNGGLFIWNQNTTAQVGANFWISGKGIIGGTVDTGEPFQVTNPITTAARFTAPWDNIILQGSIENSYPTILMTNHLGTAIGVVYYNSASQRMGLNNLQNGTVELLVENNTKVEVRAAYTKINNSLLVETVTDDGTNKLQVNGRAKVGGGLHIGLPSDWDTNYADYVTNSITTGKTTGIITIDSPADGGNATTGIITGVRLGVYHTSTFFGARALSKLPTITRQRQCDAFGYEALNNAEQGDNAAFAGWALSGLVTGVQNAAFGIDSLWRLTTGTGNSSFGQYSLNNLREGNNNTGVGRQTAAGLWYGDSNTFLGANIAVPSDTFSNTVIIASGEGGTGAYRFYSPASGNVLFGTTVDMLLEKLQVVGGFRTDTARVTALAGTGSDSVIADANGTLHRSGGAIASGLIQNQIAAGQVANYWITGAGIINGYMNIGVASTANVAKLRVEGAQAVYAGTGRGGYFKNTLTASANLNTLVGLDIDTTFNVGAYVDVQTLALRTGSGAIQFGSLAGADTRSLTVLADGTLSTAPLPDADVTATTIIPITGTQNGDNRGFTLASEPIAGAALMLFINGQLLHEGNEYTRVGTAITFDPLYPAPTAEKVIMAYGVVIAGTDKYKPITLHIKATGGITTGVKTFTTAAYAGYITGWQIVSDVVGDIVVDVYKQSYDDFVYPGSAANSITGTEKITLTGARKNRNLNPASWDNVTAEGDMLTFHVDSVSTVNEVVITLFLKESA